MTWTAQAAAAGAGVLAVALLAALALRLAGRPLVRLVLARFLRRLFTDPYHENLWETVTGVRRFGAQAVVETELRAASGEMIMRPFGRFRTFPGFDQLLFDPAQLDRLPTPEHVPVDMSVVLGPRAARPLRVEMPVLITGMGYAVALSPEAKEALARGAALAGTATNTGMGPLLPDERREARSLIVQYNRGEWGNPPEALRQADAVEIQLGNGAWAGSGFRVLTRDFTPEARRAFRLRPGQEGSLVHNRMPGLETAADLAALVAELRAVGGGVPVGLKLAAGDRIESDLEAAVRAGVDYVQVDGAEGGIHQAAPTLADDFGLPTFIALCRAARFLAGLAPPERPSLIASGGLFTPGHFLKALALGADAVAIGTAALFALGHGQTFRALPWEPPLDLVLYGRPAARRLDVERAARSLARYLASVAEELAVAVRALGKASLAEVNREDLFTMEPWVARVAGVRLAWAGRAPSGKPSVGASTTARMG
jgi:glutamate synthase domain-containing protein 2